MSEVESLASSLADLSLSSGSKEKHADPELYHEKHSPDETPTLADPQQRDTATSMKSAGQSKDTLNLEPSQSARNTIASRPSQTASIRTANRVAVADRRGLVAQFTLIPEYNDPRQYTPKTKLTIVAVVAFAAIAGPMGTAIVLPAIDNLAADLNTTLSMVNVSVGIYLLSMGVFPMWWSNFSEKHGRRTVYVISFTWFFAFSVACAVAPNISALIVLRLLAGVGASSVQACGAGTISDIYIQEERGTALGLFYLGPLLGPFISPIIGGAVATAWGWRATFWVMVIVCGINVVSIIFLLPETLPRDNFASIKAMLEKQFSNDENVTDNDLERMATNMSQSSSLRRQVLDDPTPVDLVMPTLLRLSTNQTAYLRRVRDFEAGEAEASIEQPKHHWSSVLYDYAVRPTHAVVFLAYPPVLIAILYSAIGFMGIYFFNIVISNEYSQAPYNFSSVIVGLLYIPNSITYILASIYGGRWLDYLIKKSASEHDGEMRPESRISWNIVVAAVLFPPGCLIFGWCIDKKEHWVTPLIGSAIFGFASMLVIGATVTYLIDVLPGKGATGVALNNLVRQVLAATATFITEPITLAVGPGVLFCIYAGLLTAAAICPFILKRRGANLRQQYDITKYYAKL